MPKIPDITDTEAWIVQTTLSDRYGCETEYQLADAQIRLQPSVRELTSRPVVFWQADHGCSCIISEPGERNYRCQFYQKPYKQMGTGVDEYDDLAECLVSVLQAQADHLAEQRGGLPGKHS